MEQKQTSKSINKWIVSAVVVAVIALVTVAVVPQVVQAQDVTPTTPQDSETTTQDSDTATEQVPPPGRREFGMPEPGRHGPDFGLILADPQDGAKRGAAAYWQVAGFSKEFVFSDTRADGPGLLVGPAVKEEDRRA